MRVSQELLSDLKAALPAVRPIEIVDVGASNISAEIPSYDRLLGSGLARLTAFEPNPAEFSRLVSDDTRRYLPYAIGSGGSADLHITVSPGFCSTLKPNDRINAFIQSFAKLSAVTSRQTIETRRLDDLAEVERIDFLKIDIQGASWPLSKAVGTSLLAHSASRPRSPSSRSTKISRSLQSRMPC